jgi:hypothetical protein
VDETSKASERDLFWEFARAESDSARYASYLAPNLTPKLIAALAADNRSSLSEGDWGILRQAVWALRWPLLSELLDLGVTWSYGPFETKELGNVRFIRMTAFIYVAPSRTLSELALAHQVGNSPQGEDFGEKLGKILRSFDPQRMRGAPVLLTENGAPPYLLIEGLSRTTALTIRFQKGENIPQRIRVLFGVCPKLRTWKFY